MNLHLNASPKYPQTRLAPMDPFDLFPAPGLIAVGRHDVIDQFVLGCV